MSKILIIKSIIVSSAAWRGRVAEDFSCDARNAVAKDMLDKLASDTVPDEIADRLNKYSDTEVAREATIAAKLVGFRDFPNTLSSFAKEVIDRIEISHTEWANTFRRPGGAL